MHKQIVRMITVNFESIKDVRGSFCDLFNVISQYLSGETGENHEDPIRVALWQYTTMLMEVE